MDKNRFCQLWKRCSTADERAATAVFAELAAHYQGANRYYHTGAHIEDCLSRLDLAAAELGQSDSVELAIWCHDVIYAAGVADNEQRSADWFAEKASGLLAPRLIQQVAGYIMSTTHGAPPVDEGAKLVVDVDLSGLGMEDQFFRRDGDNIRKEFAHLSDAEFARGQGAFLRALLDRERIYATDFFYALCETRARENIHRALARYAE